MEYSAKYRVSISTLRRRIKAGELEFQFTEGKYLLKDVSLPVEPVAAGSEVVAPPTQAKQPQIQLVPSASNSKVAMAPVPPPAATKIPPPSNSEVGPQVEKLLAEIKKAYMQILQEKEEQILLLRSEMSDLKTLVSVLEEQNNQLKQKDEAAAATSASSLADSKFELDLEL
jgi:hypothetical protein